MSSKLLNDFLNGRLKWFYRGINANAAISTLFTFFGAQQVFDAQTLIDKALSVALALASGIMIILIWRTLFESARSETTVAERLASLVKTFIGAMAITAASTWLMVAGFAQNTVDKVHMLEGVTAAERHTAEVYEQAVAAGQLVPQIAALAAELARWSTLEHAEGVSTGISGPGAVVSALAETANNLGTLGSTIHAAMAEFEGLRQVAAERTAGMRAAAGSTAPADARWQEFGTHEAAWRTAVTHIEAGQLLRGVVAGLEAASRDLGAVVVLSRNPTVAAKQQDALARYRALTAQRTAPVIAHVRDLMAATRAQAPVVERIGVAVAVLEHWSNFIIFWVLGLGIDFAAPLIMLISIHVATATTTPRDRFIARVLDTTVADQAAAKMAGQMLKRIDLDEHSGDLINNVLIGREPETEQGRVLASIEPSDRASRGRTIRIVLMLVALAVAMALVAGATLYVAGGGGSIMAVPPSGPVAPPPAPQVEPGCTMMPNGIMVCDPNAPSLTGVTDRHPGRAGAEGGVGIASADAEPKGSCISDTFPPRPEAVAIVEAILSTVGVTRNFQVLESVFQRECIAVAGEVNGERAIVYDSKRFRWSGGRVVWSEAGIMAHEIGHLLMSHPRSTPSRELEADYFAGFALARLGGSLAQALSWTPMVGEKGGDTHPPRLARIRTAALGWGEATVQMIPATSQNTWLGDEFEMAAATCRLARVVNGTSFTVRITCERAGQWVWAD